MYAELFRIGPFTAYSYGMMLGLGFIVALFLAGWEGKRRGVNEDRIYHLGIILFVAGLIGSRLYYVVFNWEYYQRNLWSILRFSEGGLALQGGVFGGIIAGIYLLRRYRLNFWLFADTFTPSILIATAMGRMGCFLNGCCYGVSTSLPWGIYIHGGYRHPTQLYEAVWCVFLFAVVWLLRKPLEGKRGRLFIIYLSGYSAGRFVIESFRGDSLLISPGLKTAQVASLATLVVALGCLVWLHYQDERQRLGG